VLCRCGDRYGSDAAPAEGRCRRLACRAAPRPPRPAPPARMAHQAAVQRRCRNMRGHRVRAALERPTQLPYIPLTADGRSKVRRTVAKLLSSLKTAPSERNKRRSRMHVACLKYQPRHGRSRGWDRHRLNALAEAPLHRGHGPARERVEEPPHAGYVMQRDCPSTLCLACFYCSWFDRQPHSNFSTAHQCCVHGSRSPRVKAGLADVSAYRR